MEIAQVKTLLAAGLPEAQHIEVTGDGRHFAATIISTTFAGKTLLQRHRQVLAAVQQEIAQDTLHALSITAKTPAEIAANT